MALKRVFLLLFLLLLIIPKPSFTESIDPEKIFAGANDAYSSGKFEEAITAYLRIARDKGVSAALLYNLGNSYAAQGDTGKAVVNYNRALRLAPMDRDIRHNLQQVRKEAGLYSENQPFYLRGAELLAADQWALIATTAFLFFSVVTLLPYLGLTVSFFPFRGLMLSSLLIIMLTVPAALYRYRDINSAVVTGKKSGLLISPFPTAASSGSLKSGRLVRPIKSHSTYILVRDKTDRTGWINKADLEFINDLPQ